MPLRLDPHDYTFDAHASLIAHFRGAGAGAAEPIKMRGEVLTSSRFDVAWVITVLVGLGTTIVLFLRGRPFH